MYCIVAVEAQAEVCLITVQLFHGKQLFKGVKGWPIDVEVSYVSCLIPTLPDMIASCLHLGEAALPTGSVKDLLY